jgi:hypothetical protein
MLDLAMISLMLEMEHHSDKHFKTPWCDCGPTAGASAAWPIVCHKAFYSEFVKRFLSHFSPRLATSAASAGWADFKSK